MSETHVPNSGDGGGSGSTGAEEGSGSKDARHIVDLAHNPQSEQNNNNSNVDVRKRPLLNNNNDDSNENDEIIEEFDISDSDLKTDEEAAEETDDDSDSASEIEQNDYDDEMVHNSVATADNNDKSTTKGPTAIALAAATAANESATMAQNEKKPKKELQQSENTHTTPSEVGDHNCADIHQVSTAAAAAAADKSKTIPTNLELTVDASNSSAPVPDTYCPITPRRIMDVVADDEEESSAFPRLKKATQIVGESSKDAVDDDDDVDDGADVDDELLVQFLGEANHIAEARLAARRQARAEAREIRMRELERQQKEQEQNADRVFDMHTASGIDPLSRSRLASGIGSSPLGSSLLSTTRGNSMSSRRSSEDSLEEEGRSLRDIRHELKDVEERFRKAMIANAQLDNERASQTYQIQLLKDKLEEMEESYAQLQREFKEKSRDCNALKRNLDKLNEELKLVQGQLSERDTLIAEQGLVILAVENEDGSDARRALVSVENAQLLGSVQGSLDVRLKKFGEEKQQLQAEVQHLQEQLENYKSQGKGGRGNSMNGPLGSDEDYEAQREANKIISDYKYKLQKAEQEIASLQASLARSETQVIRYKSTAEAAEKAEAELKIERRKLQRENRETTERLEELETSNNHLLKRLDKLKNAKSALLKDL